MRTGIAHQRRLKQCDGQEPLGSPSGGRFPCGALGRLRRCISQIRGTNLGASFFNEACHRLGDMIEDRDLLLKMLFPPRSKGITPPRRTAALHVPFRDYAVILLKLPERFV